MTKLGRVLGVTGFVALLSVPLTLFLWDWQFTWVAAAKLAFGVLAIGFWVGTNLRALRASFQGRSLFYWIMTGTIVGVVAFLLVLLNITFVLRPVQFDMTPEQIFSLSDQSRQALGALQDGLEVRAFYGGKEPEVGPLKAQLEMYRGANPLFAYEFVDPVARPDLVERYKISPSGPRILLNYRDREERVKLGDPESSGPEEAITNALLRLTRTGEPEAICFTTGHGEKALKGAENPRQSVELFVNDLGSEGFRAQSISLLELPEVPAACKAVAVVGPQHPLLADELACLERYLSGGGRLLVFAGSGEAAELAGLLTRWGLVLGGDTVVYPKGRSPLDVVTDPTRYPKSHPIFSRFFQGGLVMLNQLQAVFPLARTVSAGKVPGSLQATELAYSTDNAWAERGPVAGVDQVAFDEGQDRPGPVPLAATVERRADVPSAGGGGGTRLAVFGSSLLVVDQAYRLFAFNRNLVLNTLAWLMQDEGRITIRPRLRAASLLRLEEGEMKFVTFFSTDILPLLILAFGIGIWQVRRSS